MESKGYFEVRRRSTGKPLKDGRTWNTRQDAKRERDDRNAAHYLGADGGVPMYNREFYVARTKWHRKGRS